MVYILNSNLKKHKIVVVELCRVYGIGKYQAINLCHNLHIGSNCRVIDLNQFKLFQLLKEVEKKKYILGNELIQQKKMNIADLIETKSYRGLRHIFKIPLKKQRSQTLIKRKKTK